METAIVAVAAGSRVCRAVQAKLGELRTITKDDQSPVTIADFASQAVIANVLRERLGSNLILVAEESAAQLRGDGDDAKTVRRVIAGAARDEWPGGSDAAILEAIDLGMGDPVSTDARSEGFWTLDPIDGTKGFLRGEQYAVALAFIQNGAPVLGVLGCPNLDPDSSCRLDQRSARGTLFAAARGRGATQIDGLDAKGSKQAVRAGSWHKGEPVSLARSVETAHSNRGGTDGVMREADLATTSLYLDSQCKYAVVARGQAHVYLRLPVKRDYIERIWDHAAGALIAQEAGAIVSDAAGRALDFSRGRGLEANRGVCVAPAEIHGRIVDAIGRVFGSSISAAANPA